MNSSTWKSILKGIKIGWAIPTLPDNIIKFQMHPLIRILRVLGGISTLYLLSIGLNKSLTTSNIYLVYVALFFNVLFTIYHVYIAYNSAKHIIKLWKDKKLEVRNSPLDRIASLAVKAIACLKGACDQAQPAGNILGLMVGTDAILTAANQDPIFTPFLASIVNKVLPPKEGTTSSVNELHKRIEEWTSLQEDIASTSQLSNKFNSLSSKEGFSKEDLDEFKKLLQENREKLVEESNSIKNKIVSLLNKNK